MKRTNKPLLLLIAGLFSAGLSTTVAAATHNFTSGGTPSTQIGSGFGNALDFGDLTVTAWATTGNPFRANALLDVAQILRFGTGLGACNKDEGTNCSNPIHQVDNVGADDLVLFLFDQQVQFDQIVIDPFGEFDRDVSFWIGDITPAQSDLTGLDPVALRSGTSIFGGITDDFNSIGSGPLAINLGGSIGNALLFSALLNVDDDPSRTFYDRFKIKLLKTTELAVIPIPAAVWLFGSGLIGLIGIARRRC